MVCLKIPIESIDEIETVKLKAKVVEALSYMVSSRIARLK
jgi:hypothetical protein